MNSFLSTPNGCAKFMPYVRLLGDNKDDFDADCPEYRINGLKLL